MRLGCHAVLFKDKIKSDMDQILKGIAGTGFAGFEMGARFFGTDDREYFKDVVEKYGLELTGLHIGGKLQVWAENPEENLKKVLAGAEFVRDMPNKNVLLSGSDFPEGNTVVVAKNIEEAAKQCAEMGVALHYHNHDWEFLNNARVFKALVEYAPSVSFAFDLGWVFKGGFDPIGILKECRNRISYLHLRDPKEKVGRDFPDLGEGLFDYAQLLNEVEGILGKDNWAIVEYERGEEDMSRYGKAREFLKKFGY